MYEVPGDLKNMVEIKSLTREKVHSMKKSSEQIQSPLQLYRNNQNNLKGSFSGAVDLQSD
jgi:hypothetical protein